MQCPNCGGTANAHLVTVEGETMYLCTRPLHSLQVNRREHTVEFRPYPSFCDTMIDRNGRKFVGDLAYVTGGEVKTLHVQ